LNAGLHGGSRANLYKSLARLQGETDFGDGTAHITLQTSKEDFDKAVGELKKSGVKVLIDKPVERPSGGDSISSIRRGTTSSCTA
jgi:hypothetical protein